MHLAVVLPDHVVQIGSEVAHQPANAIDDRRELRRLEDDIMLLVGFGKEVASVLLISVSCRPLLVLHLFLVAQVIEEAGLAFMLPVGNYLLVLSGNQILLLA